MRHREKEKELSYKQMLNFNLDFILVMWSLYSSPSWFGSIRKARLLQGREKFRAKRGGLGIIEPSQHISLSVGILLILETLRFANRPSTAVANLRTPVYLRLWVERHFTH